MPMAMVMDGEVQLPAPREVVWAKLNDAEVLKACIPGCESLEKLSETEFQAAAGAKSGPVKAKFKGKVPTFDLGPPTPHLRSRAGDPRGARFAPPGAPDALTPQ